MATTTGNPLPSRGEVWWVRIDKRRPALVMQSNKVREARTRTFLIVPLTSRLHLEGLPGNVRLEKKMTGLPKTSVANVYDIQKALREDFLQRLARLSDESLRAVEDGLKLILDL